MADQAGMASSPRDVLLRYLDDVAAQRWDTLPELYAEDAVVLRARDGRIIESHDYLGPHRTR